MAAGERRISRPKRVLYMAILIPLLGVPGTASEITGPESGVGMRRHHGGREDADQIGSICSRAC